MSVFVRTHTPRTPPAVQEHAGAEGFVCVGASSKAGEIDAQDVDAQAAQAQDIDALTVTLRPIPGVLPGVPLAVRWRGALKVLLRRFGLRASWPAAGPIPPGRRLRAASGDGKRQGVDCGKDVQP